MSVDPQDFREAMASWASGVTIVAVRTEQRIVATTVSSFLSLSLDPPMVLVAVGPNATVRPFLQPGAAVGISVLGAGQRRLATVFADAYPVGEPPFVGEGQPVIRDALVAVSGNVTETRSAADQLLVIVSVSALQYGAGAPLIRYRRRYHELVE